MTAVALDTRRAHQRRVATLLEELEERRRHLYRLKARGARLAGVRDQRHELEAARRELVTAVGGTPAAPAC